MPMLRLSHAVALAAVLSACGERAPTTPPPAPAALADKPADAAAAAPATATATPGQAPAMAVGAPAGTPSGAPGAPTAVAAPQATAAAPAPTSPAPASPTPGSPTPGSPTPGSPAPASPAPGSPAPAASPSPPVPSPVATVIREAVAVAPGGAVLPLERERDTVVEPGATFVVVLSVASPDARLVLLDPKDALVAAAEAHEVGQGTRLTLSPSAPLAPGRRYALRVDGAATRELHDGAGKAFTPSVLTIRVAGTAQPEPKEPQATRRRHRRR